MMLESVPVRMNIEVVAFDPIRRSSHPAAIPARIAPVEFINPWTTSMVGVHLSTPAAKMPVNSMVMMKPSL